MQPAPSPRSSHLALLLGLAIAALAFAWVFAFGVGFNREGAPSASLSEKLAHQWQLYERARAEVIERTQGGGTIRRREWEALLRPVRQYRWTASDLDQLRRDHRDRIDATAQEARAASAIDLDQVRQDGRVREFSNLLPKGGMLHVHPNGTLQPETVERLLRLGDPAVGRKRAGYSGGFAKGELAFLDDYPDEFRYLELRAEDQVRFRALFLLPETTSAFRRFAAVFPLVGLLRQIPELRAWDQICDDFFKRANAHRVRYVEFTMHVEPSLDALRELEETARVAQVRYGITLRVNAAFDRTAAPQENLARLRRLTEFLAANPSGVVVGIDLSGNETGYPALEAGQHLYGYAQGETASAALLHRTIHAGAGDPRNMRDALLMAAERVGHGTQAFADPVALEFAISRRVPVEANIVSNVRLGYAESFAEHPFLDLLRLGLRVSLSTDDEGILATDITNEFAVAIAHTDITYAEVRQLVLNSIETSFAAHDEKERLRATVENDLREFEKLWPTIPHDRQQRDGFAPRSSQ